MERVKNNTIDDTVGKGTRFTEEQLKNYGYTPVKMIDLPPFVVYAKGEEKLLVKTRQELGVNGEENQVLELYLKYKG